MTLSKWKALSFKRPKNVSKILAKNVLLPNNLGEKAKAELAKFKIKSQRTKR